MTLMHYSDEPITFDRTKTYDPDESRYGHMKPYGLWVSVAGEDDWPAWCRDNEFRPECLAHPHRVDLCDNARILWIDTPDGIDNFHAEYSVASPFDLDASFPSDFRFNQRFINWSVVAKDYDGIIIAPYQWSRRSMGPMWYYGWDCASGCIWSTDVITSFEAVALTR
jgi:hypothetical protein